MIKRMFCAVSLLAFICQGNAMLVESYAKYAYKFSKDTDLIRGYILSSDGILKTARFSGNIKYFYNADEQYDGTSCSFKDIGQPDPVADLLVQLFPSCGSSLNAQGNGSIAFIKEKQTDFIRGMFSIDADVRKSGKDSVIFTEIKAIGDLEGSLEGSKEDGRETYVEKLKEFGSQYFGLKRGNVGYFERLFRLGRNIANAVMSERREGIAANASLQRKPYPLFYTNDLICAYVWNALPTNKLDELARKLGYTEGREPYHSKMTDRVLDEMRKTPSLVPFYAGQQIITNSKTEYNGQKFADCVETTVRQLFSCIFCKSVLNEREEYTGELMIDLSRIPDQATELREFFAPAGKLRDIREIANDGSPETRKMWASIMSGHSTISGADGSVKPLISYADADHNMYGGWSNIIKIFCFLMDGYSADQSVGQSTSGGFRAGKRIKEVNEAVKAGTFTMTKDTLLLTINDLLGIRTDIKMIAEENPQMGILQNANSDIEGCVSIYPEGYEKGNRLNFVSYKTHAQLQSIPRSKNSSSTSSPVVSADSWIELLYSNRELAIRGKEINPMDQSYPKLRESIYPSLDFYMRIGGGIRQEWLIPTLCDMLTTSMPHIEAIARQFFNVDTSLALPEFLKAAQEKSISMQLLIDICSLVAEHSNCTGNAVSAINFLRRGKASGFVEKLSRTTLDTSDQRNLIIQRMAFGNHEMTDPIIRDFVKEHSTREVFELLFEIYASYAWEDDSKVPIFSATMLETFIPHIQMQIEKIKSKGVINEVDIYGTLGVLDLIGFEEIPPIITEFIKEAAKTQKPHFFPLISNISRSQEKLDLLLPISLVTKTPLADRIFEEHSKTITLPIAASIIMKVSEENILPLVSGLKATETQLSTSIIHELISRDNPLVNDDLYMSNCKRIKKIIETLAMTYGKFNDEIARELIEMFPRLLSVITMHSEFTDELKDVLISKFDMSEDDQFLKYQILLSLLNSNYAFIPEVCERMQVGGAFWAQLSINTKDKMKEMSDELIFNIAKHFARDMRVYTFTDRMPDIRNDLVTELEGRVSMSTDKKEGLIEDLRNYGSRHIDLN